MDVLKIVVCKSLKKVVYMSIVHRDKMQQDVTELLLWRFIKLMILIQHVLLL